MRNLLFLIACVLLLLPGRARGQLFFSTYLTPTSAEICEGDSVEAYIYFSKGTAPYSAVISNDQGVYKTYDGLSAENTIYLKTASDNRFYISAAKSSKDHETAIILGSGVDVTVYARTPVEILMDHHAFLLSDPGIVLNSAPPGGIFMGPGVVGSKFYPSIAGYENSPHLITCTYTNASGCKSRDAVELYVLSGIASLHLVSGNDTITALCEDGANYHLIGANEDNIPGTFSLMEAGSPDPVEGAIVDSDPNDDEAILDPAGLKGNYNVVYTYGVEGLDVSVTLGIEVDNPDVLGISGVPDSVCRNHDPYTLLPELGSPDPSATYTISGPGVYGNQADGFYFDPSSPDALEGDHQIILAFESSKGCRATSVKTVHNGFVPAVGFTLSPACIPAEGGLVSFDNITSGKYAVAGWSWDFGDPGSGVENTSNEENPEHFYDSAGSRTIGLSAITFEGCQSDYQMDTVLTDQPIADFTWISDCFVRGEPTAFLNRSSSEYAEIDSVAWTFRTRFGGVLGTETGLSPEDTAEFKFGSVSEYSVSLYIENTTGCSGEVTRTITLFPVQVIPAEGYDADFNSGGDGWKALSDDGLSSWVLGEPDFTGFDQVQGDLAWYTDLPADSTEYMERSWVQSPCFDLSAFSSPVIQMDLMKSFFPFTDGAVLQYQGLVSDGWKTLGSVGGGINWYNVQEIINEPGGSSFGWGLAVFEPDKRWVEASHALNVVSGSPYMKLRIAVGTGGGYSIGNQGFAFDNFHIEQRSKKSVLEYFTNAASPEALVADGVVDTFYMNHSGTVYDLQYHMDYPGEDDMNDNNPYPASTRSFNYGVPGVPYAVLNGGIEPGHRYDFSSPAHYPDEQSLMDASLEMPLFDLRLSLDFMEHNLEGSAEVVCMTDTFSSNLQLYIVVIEQEVTLYTGLNQDTAFRNVVLDMLPSPTGKLLGNDWYKGSRKSIDFSWVYADYVEDTEELSVIAFVQDRHTGSVLQAVSRSFTPGVDVQQEQDVPLSLMLFPNPARDRLNINFGSQVEHSGTLTVTDLTGRVALTTDIRPGYTIRQLDISHLPDGIYMVSWTESSRLRGYNKLVVSR